MLFRMCCERPKLISCVIEYSLSRREESYKHKLFACLLACLLVCPQGKKNIDFGRWLLLAIDGPNTVGLWVIGGGEFESDVSFN